MSTRRFWLVQTLRRSPAAQFRKVFPKATVKSNPFGYGRMGDYEFDYMGWAEFEFGTIPAANNRLAEAGKDLKLETKSYGGFDFDMLWIGAEGDPHEDWVAWIEDGCEGKERPYLFVERLEGKDPPSYTGEDGWDGVSVVWWALDENVLWAFAGTEEQPGHLIRMLQSMTDEPAEFLR